ncbi:hypothetical protein Clacol_009084 [Clathrus columnatus]|uniref:Uncharacterized protein n=1 Tax=Clathrus columnatus TaxID=1419009 RepID=A0AAV5APJ9_9AGAM|nr:hypothetical protein Clacol_009084 [Clathrus columnatus]
MGWLDLINNSDAHDQPNSEDIQQVTSGHKGSVTHGLLAAAASYEAAKAYEKHVADNGKPDNHAQAKEILAAFSGAFIDQVVETKGLDFIDKEKAKHDAKKHIDENFTETTYVEEYGQQPHKAEFSHELIAGAASFEAAKAYEKHCAANGKPASHALAKELLAGFAGAFIDREVETKGLDFIDREKAKRHAEQHVDENFTENVYVENY